MTYAEREESVYEGSPVELYQFDREGGAVWRYTSADEDQIYLANTFTAVPIQRNDIEASQDIERAILEINIAINTDFAQQFIIEPQFVRYSVTLWRYHVGDAQVVSLWVGRVINVTISESKATVLCESSQSSLRRSTLRRLYQKNCPHMLYGEQCTVNKESFKTIAVVASFSGLDITAPQYFTTDSTYFLGGYVEIQKGDIFVRRFITNYNRITATITINLPIYDLSIGDELISYPGCDHTVYRCLLRFGNIFNFGGQPWIPTRNPMTGTPIF